MGLMPYVRPTFDDANSVLATGYQLFFYIAGTTTKQDTFTDSSLAVANPNPIILNARGEPDNVGTPIDVYFTPGLSYKVVYATDTDTDPPTSAIWTVDNVTDSGGGGSAGASGQWLTGITAVYVNGNTFKLTGVDLTTDFHKGRKVWVSGGNNRYVTIFTSSFAVDTTVTLVDIQDSTGAPAVLDPAMTTAALSIQRVDADKGIHYRFYPGTEAGVTNFEFPIGDIRRYGALMDDVDDDAAFVACVAATPAGGSIFIADGIAAINAITLTKKVHIHGDGQLKQISANSDFITFGVGSDGSTIENLIINANQTPGVQFGKGIVITVANIVIRNNNIRDAEWGVHVSTATAIGTKIVGNRIHTIESRNINCDVSASEIKIIDNKLEASDEGIRITACSDAIIDNNIILDFLLGGIRIYEDSVAPAKTSEVIITNNYLNNDATAATTAPGIEVLSSDYVNIADNIVDKVKDTGIIVDRLTPGEPASIGCNIIGNIIVEPVDTGIHIGLTDQTVVVNNNLFTNGVSNYGINIAGTGAGGADNIISANNIIGACVITDYISVGSGLNAILGENSLSTGDIRHGSLVFNGGALTIQNVAYQQCLGISTSTDRPRGFSFIATWPGGTAVSNAVNVGAYSDQDWEVLLASGKTYHDYFPIVVSKTNTSFRLSYVALFPPAGYELACFVVKTTTEALS